MTDEQQAAIDRARAFGLVTRVVGALIIELPSEERYELYRMLEEAEGLWTKHEAK